MGLFGFGKKKEPKVVDEKTAWNKVSLADLMFAYTKVGDVWSDHEPNERKLGLSASGNFSKAYKNCIKLGILRQATPLEKLDFLSMKELQGICTSLDIKSKRSKADTRAAILERVGEEELATLIPEDYFALTDLAGQMLAHYDFVPYCLDHYRGEHLDYTAMTAARNADPKADLFDVILAGVSKEYMTEQYIESYLEDEDGYHEEGTAEYREWARDQKTFAKEDAAEDYKELVAKIKADKKEASKN